MTFLSSSKNLLFMLIVGAIADKLLIINKSNKKAQILQMVE